MISSFGNIIKKPLVGFGVVGTKTFTNCLLVFLLMFPKEDVIYLDLTFEEASKFIISAGTSNPS